jgi:3-isopropylmalate/(R)-2-methylmalate dehydratase small subunit
LDRAGLGSYAFHDRRFDPQGAEQSGFVLNRAPFRDAVALVAGANFGCGSSREQAVWTLTDFGVRCVIATSFGDIFFDNCGKNGLLAIRLPPAEVAKLQRCADEGARFVIDLPKQTVRADGLAPIAFAIAADLKASLINGWNEADRILNEQGQAIDAFENRHRRAQPWLFVDD